MSKPIKTEETRTVLKSLSKQKAASSDGLRAKLVEGGASTWEKSK